MSTRAASSRWIRALGLCGLAALSACQSVPMTPERAEADCRPAEPALPTTTLATPAPPRTPSVALQGQLSVKLEAFGDQAAKGTSFGFFFQGHAEAGDLDLMTPLGSQVAHLRWSPHAVELVDSDGPHHYASLAELSTSALGEALPLDTLIHWMQGQADPALPVLAGHAPDTFEQLGWQIDASELGHKKLTAVRPASPVARGVRIKVYLDR